MANLALVQQAGQFTAGATSTLTFPAPVTVGNLLVLWAAGFAAGPPTIGGNITVAGWTAIGSHPMAGPTGMVIYQYAGIVTGAGTTLSATLATAPYTYIGAAEFSGAPASTVADGTPSDSTAASGQPTTSFTSVNPSDLVVAGSLIQGGSDNGPPASGWGVVNVASQMVGLYQVANAAGSFTPQWASTTNTGWVATSGAVRIPVQTTYKPGYPVSALIEEPSEGMEQSNVVPQP